MIRALITALIAALVPTGASACGVALVMGLDVSSSVDDREYNLQVDGLVDALQSPEVTEAILASDGGGILAAAFMWSGQENQRIMADWAWLESPDDIKVFSDSIRSARRESRSWPTALGQAAAYAAALHGKAPQNCDRKVIDISGDGINNSGAHPDSFAEANIFEGLIINGLVIRGATPDPHRYYVNRLIYGPSAFVEIAENYADYPRAIKRKLLRELTPAAYAMVDP